MISAPHPLLAAPVAAAILVGETLGVEIRVIESYRPSTRQQELYAHGRHGDPRPVVTAIDGVSRHSLHEYADADGSGALAVDLGVFRAGRHVGSASVYLGAHPAYEAAGEAAERAGATWGGRWAARDLAHLEVPEASRVRELQRRLSVAGEAPGSVDGDFGPRTLAALTSWCARSGLPRPRVPARGSWWWAVTPAAWAGLRPGTW